MTSYRAITALWMFLALAVVVATSGTAWWWAAGVFAMLGLARSLKGRDVILAGGFVLTAAVGWAILLPEAPASQPVFFGLAILAMFAGLSSLELARARHGT